MSICVRSVVGYVRVSTDEQAVNGYGAGAQRDDLRAYCQQEGLDLAEIYEDLGVSGAKLERPALNRLLGDAAAGTVGTVIVPKLDRLSRDLFGQLWIEKELLKYHAEIASIAEPFRGDDPANKLFRQIIGAFAEFERSRISERLFSGRLQAAAQGKFAGGVAPTGYKTRKGSKRLHVDPQGAALVKRVFEIRDERPKATLHQIATQLSEEGYRGPKGGHIFAMNVKRILDRRAFYAGEYAFCGKKARGVHEALIE